MISPGKVARVLAVICSVAASTFFASASRADPIVIFTECDSGPQSSSSPEPTLTPPPTEEPNGQAPEATPAPQDCMPPEGDRIWGDRLLRFEIDDDGYNVKGVKLSILSQEDAIPSANGGKPVASWTPDNDQRTFGYDWDSSALTPYNGSYKVRVDVTATGFTGSPHNASGERVDLRVDNPPKAIAAPKILSTTIESVTISWPKATEADALSYTIYRASVPEGTKDPKTPPYGDFEQIGVTATQSFRDSTVKPGTHWYAVKVTRRSVVTPETGISSSFSPASAPATIKSPVKPDDKKSSTGKLPPHRYIPFRQLTPPRPRTISAQVPDAPFAYKLPYGSGDSALGASSELGSSGGGVGDPRGPVLPVAVGMFLLSSALAVGRMPY